MSPSNETIAVALDFGTTYSGVTYMKLNGRERLPTQLGRWPGKPEASTTHKVPTVVAYPRNQNGDPTLWGFSAEDSSDSTYWKVQLFKLMLDPTTRVDSTIIPPGVGLKDVVYDYIQGLYTNIVKVLKDDEIYDSNTELNFTLTVPVTFEDNTIEHYREIIQGTAIGGHKFVISLTEPEAASFHAINAAQIGIHTNTTNLNDCFTICDAGGGTVDLSSYIVSGLGSDLLFKHTGQITGEYCGSTIIDREFNSYVQSLMGEEPWKTLAPEKKVSMTREFIRRKERFDDNPDDENFNIFLGNIPCPGKKGQYLPISREQMRRFFSGSVAGIQKMINSHIVECRHNGHEVRFIFLVGGLGSSPYVKQEVEKYFCGRRLGPKVIQPQNALQAVALGAISDHVRFLQGGKSLVGAKICRANYGFVAMKPYDPDRNFEGEKFVDPLSSIVMAKDQLKWVIYKGDQITGELEKCLEERFTREFVQCKGKKKNCTEQVCKNGWHCQSGWEEVLVKSFADREQLQHSVGPGVRKVCRLALNLRSLQNDDFEKIKKGKGHIFSRSTEYYRISYTIRIYIGSVSPRVEVIFKDKPSPNLMTVSWNKDGEAGH